MRKIKLMEHISLDGIIAPESAGMDREYSNGGWTAPYRSPAGRDAVLAAQGEGFDLLLGRRTHDLWSEYWPKAEGNPFASSLNAAKKYVVTHRPDSLTWGPFQALGEDFTEEVRRLKATEGPDLILWGSSTLASALLEGGLAEEVLLLVYPVLFGQGKRFFSDSTPPCSLTLVETKATATGIVMNTYRPAAATQGTP